MDRRYGRRPAGGALGPGREHDLQGAFQLLRLRWAEGGQEAAFHLVGQLGALLHQAATLRGEHDPVLAPVGGVGLAGHQSLLLQRIDQRHHRRAIDPQPLGHRALGQVPLVIEAEQCGPLAGTGAGPALGRAVARRYAREGYTVTLVARRPEPLERMTAELIRTGATAHAVAADLSGTAGVPGLADRIRSAAGDPDVLYYGPTISGVLPAAELTPERLEPFLRVPLYTLVALVREFLPHMIGQHDGAVLLAAGASAVRGLPNFSGPGPALAAQRNYVQSLHAELAAGGVYAGGLYRSASTRKIRATGAAIRRETETCTRPWRSMPSSLDLNHGGGCTLDA